MRRLALGFFLVLALRAADLTVCATGCGYSTMQAAIDAANPGDTITLTAGAAFYSAPFTLKNKPGSDWITIRSSRWRELPEDYRPEDGDARLATLAFTTSGQALIRLEADPAFSSDCWTSQVAGNTVTIGYLHSMSVPCEARLKNGMLFDSRAPVGTVTLLGVAVPTAGTYGAQGNGLRVGLGTNGKLWISHKSDIVYGKHFTCTHCETGKYDSWAHFNFPEMSVPVVNIGYSTDGAVTGISSRRVWLVGPWAERTDEAGLFPGTLAAAYKGPATGVHHYRFLGIRFRYDSTAESYYGTMFAKDSSNDYRYVPHHLEWDRCVFSQPKASPGFWRWIGIYHGDHIRIRNSRFLNTQTRAEGQAILTCGSLGPVTLENNEIDGGTEGFMAGGCSSPVVSVPQITARRNLLRKRLEQRPLVRLVRQSSTGTLALTTNDSTTRCNAGTCTVHYEDTAYTYGDDSTIEVASGASAKIYVGVSPAGVLTVGHNSGSNVACTGGFTCLSGVTSRAAMAEYAMLYEWTATGGEWGSSFDWSFASGSSLLLKNLFELKTGRDVVFEGNLLRNYWSSGGQNQPLGFTPRNQNGQDVFVRMDGLQVSRNRIVNTHSGIYGIGIDDMGWNTYGRGYQFSHNIILDANRTRWGDSTSGGIGFMFGSGNILGLAIDHNTIDSDRGGFYQNTASSLNSIMTTNNLWIWNTDGAYGGSYAGQGLATGFLNVRKSDWTPNAYGYVGPTSTYRGNLNLSEGTIPSAGWNSWADLPASNFTANQRAQSATLSDHLASFARPAGLSTDVRLKATSPYSVHCASGCDTQLTTTTGLNPGADVDWVDSVLDGVNEGLPERARRLALRVEAGSTGAVISLAAADAVTVKVSTHQNMKAANLVLNTSTPSVEAGGRKTFIVEGLSASTPYWYTVETGGAVVKDVFTTAGTSSSTPRLTLNLRSNWNGVSQAYVDYGPTAALGSTTEATACVSGCTVEVAWASGALFYRPRYRNATGEDVVPETLSVIVP